VTLLLAFGDSLTCGEGVGLRVSLDQTWAALVAQSLAGMQLSLQATPGARIRDVRERQVPHAPEGQLATLVVGLNDIARSGFDAGRFRRDLLATVHQLTASGASVLLGRLHDPVALLPLPRPMARLGRDRVAAVNAAVDEAACWARVHVLALDEVLALRSPSGWAVDRVHPSPSGHRAVAAEGIRVLRSAGWPASPLEESDPDRPPGLIARSWWVGRHGVPYAAAHVRELGQPALSAMLRLG
jgi:lysophospholipase L1-like esterase